MAYEWSKDEKTMHCDKCNKDFDTEGCDHAFGCTCSAHSHIDFHLTWGFAELPAFKNRTINELEGFNIDQ
jgi:hypothetical protein